MIGSNEQLIKSSQLMTERPSKADFASVVDGYMNLVTSLKKIVENCMKNGSPFAFSPLEISPVSVGSVSAAWPD